MTTRAGYQDLIEAGICIYEYLPGFIHSKTVACDDETATVGTINFDFRSLFLHFECGVWMYRTKALWQVKRTFKTLESCQEVTLEDCKRVPVYKRLFCSVPAVFTVDEVKAQIFQSWALAIFLDNWLFCLAASRRRGIVVMKAARLFIQGEHGLRLGFL